MRRYVNILYFSHFQRRIGVFRYLFQDFGMITMKNNGFVKEYVVGRKDQFDLDILLH
jgi:hypothetical protein